MWPLRIFKCFSSEHPFENNQIDTLGSHLIVYVLEVNEERNLAVCLDSNFKYRVIELSSIINARIVGNFRQATIVLANKDWDKIALRYNYELISINTYNQPLTRLLINNYHELSVGQRLMLIGGANDFRLALYGVLKSEIDRHIDFEYVEWYLRSYYFLISYSYSYRPGGDDKIWVHSETVTLNLDPFIEEEIRKIGSLAEDLYKEYGNGSYNKMYEEYSGFQKKLDSMKLNAKRDLIIQDFMKVYDNRKHKEALITWLNEWINQMEADFQTRVSLLTNLFLGK